MKCALSVKSFLACILFFLLTSCQQFPTLIAPTTSAPPILPSTTNIASSTPLSEPSPTVPATFTPEPPTATSTATPIPPGTILYKADWSGGMDGWGGLKDWKTVSGMLVNDGTNQSVSTILAPYEPGKEGIVDYAVEAEIQVIQNNCGNFGVIARDGYWGGIDITRCYGNNSIAVIFVDQPSLFNSRDLKSTSYDPGNDWHVYRLEVQGNNLRLLIDGAPLVETQDNRFLDSGRVGLWSWSASLNVKSFTVIKL